MAPDRHTYCPKTYACSFVVVPFYFFAAFLLFGGGQCCSSCVWEGTKNARILIQSHFIPLNWRLVRAQSIHVLLFFHSLIRLFVLHGIRPQIVLSASLLVYSRCESACNYILCGLEHLFHVFRCGHAFSSFRFFLIIIKRNKNKLPYRLFPTFHS